jgi:hypothetical protein
LAQLILEHGEKFDLDLVQEEDTNPTEEIRVRKRDTSNGQRRQNTTRLIKKGKCVK